MANKKKTTGLSPLEKTEEEKSTGAGELAAGGIGLLATLGSAIPSLLDSNRKGEFEKATKGQGAGAKEARAEVARGTNRLLSQAQNADPANRALASRQAADAVARLQAEGATNVGNVASKEAFFSNRALDEMDNRQRGNIAKFGAAAGSGLSAFGAQLFAQGGGGLTPAKEAESALVGGGRQLTPPSEAEADPEQNGQAPQTVQESQAAQQPETAPAGGLVGANPAQVAVPNVVDEVPQGLQRRADGIDTGALGLEALRPQGTPQYDPRHLVYRYPEGTTFEQLSAATQEEVAQLQNQPQGFDLSEVQKILGGTQELQDNAVSPQIPTDAAPVQEAPAFETRIPERTSKVVKQSMGDRIPKGLQDNPAFDAAIDRMSPLEVESAFSSFDGVQDGLKSALMLDFARIWGGE